MSKRVTVLFLSVVVVVLVAAGVAWLVWPEGGASEDDRERAFCWSVGERVSSGAGGGSVSACAARLEKAAEKDRAALRTEVRLYGRHAAGKPEGMPRPVRRALSRALAERPGLVYQGLAAGGPRDSEAARPYFDGEALSSTVLAVARDEAALRVLRTSQESYVRSRIATLTRADFDKGEDSGRVATVVEPAGRATATLTGLSQRARRDASDAERGDDYGRHGYPRIRNQLEDRARAVGVPQSDIQNSGSSMGDLKVALRRAYNEAAGETESAAHRADPS